MRLGLYAGLLLTGAVLASTGCKRAESPRVRVFPQAPVVLISIDTLRSDHLPFYGYAGVETPALSSLRNDSVLFESAWSHVPLTLPSHVTMFTGLLPDRNGVHDNLGYTVSPKVRTLAELLRQGGHATGGAVSTQVLVGTSGVSRGFDFWDDDVTPSRPLQALSRVQRPGDETEAALEGWITGAGAGSGQKDRPFFAFLHLYEPHSPYEPKEPFKSRYPNAYDAEIATADAILGKFLDFLRTNGVYDRALVILLSDHGEGLGDHGEREHGLLLYREALQVPLLVKPPKGTPRGRSSVATPVQLSDVFTTIGSAVGLQGFVAPPGTVSLLSLADDQPVPARRLYAETFFPRTHFGWSELRSLFDGRWHYIEGPRPELFDLTTDPAEKKSDQKSGPFRAMRIEMEALKTSFEAPSAVDPEAARKLASLGYLSSGAPTGSGPLDDPKDHLETVELMKEALKELLEGSAEKAVTITKRLLAENPRMLDLWELQAQALAKLGRTDEAMASLKKTIELGPPGSTQYVVSVARHCLEMGRLDEAKKHAELAREMGDPSADELLAQACLGLGDAQGAESAASRSLQAKGSKGRGYLVLARVQILKGDLPGALELAGKARGDGRVAPPGFHLLRGDILARMGKSGEAAQELRGELELYPTTLPAWTSLAFLFAAENGMREARKTLEAMVAAYPAPEAYLTATQTASVLGDRVEADRWRRDGRTRFPDDPRFSRAGSR